MKAWKNCLISCLDSLPPPISDPNPHILDYQTQRFTAHDLAMTTCALRHGTAGAPDADAIECGGVFGLSHVVSRRHVANRGHVDVTEFRMIAFSFTVKPVARRGATPPVSIARGAYGSGVAGMVKHLVINRRCQWFLHFLQPASVQCLDRIAGVPTESLGR
jgi:hypothetical protein